MVSKITPKTRCFYELDPVKRGSLTTHIEVSNPSMPTGKMMRILPAWADGLGRHVRISEVNGSGRIFITKEGKFSPLAGVTPDLKGSTIGLVRMYNAEHALAGQRVIDLGRAAFGVLDSRQKVASTIEIGRSGDPSKLKVIERKQCTRGLSEDRSAYIYNISPAGAREIKRMVPDLEWIRDVRINEDRTVTITYEYEKYDEATGRDVTITKKTPPLPAHLFVDNFGMTLLNNRRSEAYELSDIFQSTFYTAETAPFSPRIDIFRGNLKLVVHRVSERTIDMPEELKGVQGILRIFPSTAGAAVRIGEEWYPIEAEEALKESHVAMIDAGPEGFSRIEKGHIQHAVGSQNRLGGKNEEPVLTRLRRKGFIGLLRTAGNISSEYVRDFYFYGLLSRAVHRVRVKYGTYFGLNRAKAIRTEGAGAIESGRGEVFPYHMLYDLLFVDVMNTANKFYKKLSNFGRGLWPPGVSEDTQFEIDKRILGIRFWAIRLGNKLSGTNIMTAEKNLDNYSTQNEQRYVLSKVLFKPLMRLVAADMFLGRLLGTRPVIFNIAAIWEAVAGFSWYDFVFAKASEVMATPSFLGTLGYVLWLPVDLVLFSAGLIPLVLLEAANYLHHLWSLGFGAKTAFIQNPGMDLNFEGGTLDANVTMDQKKLQFAAFKLTSGGGGGAKKIRKYAKVGLYAMGGVTGVGLGGAALAALLGGFPQFAPLLGLGALVNVAFAGYGAVQLLSSAYYSKRYIKAKGKQQQTVQYANARAQDFNTFMGILSEVSKKGPSLSYKDLFDRRRRLAEILMSEPIHMLQKNGDVIADLGNEFFDMGNQMLDLYSNIEMFIVLKAGKDLNRDENDRTAARALETILYDTTQPMVIDYGGLVWRGLQARKKRGGKS